MLFSRGRHQAAASFPAPRLHRERDLKSMAQPTNQRVPGYPYLQLWPTSAIMYGPPPPPPAPQAQPRAVPPEPPSAGSGNATIPTASEFAPWPESADATFNPQPRQSIARCVRYFIRHMKHHIKCAMLVRGVERPSLRKSHGLAADVKLYSKLFQIDILTIGRSIKIHAG